MTTKRLKILIVVMIILIVFIMGYNKGHWEDLATEFEALAVVETWATTVEIIPTEEELVIYTREMTEAKLADKVDNLIGDYNISYTIVHECASQTEDYELCIKNVLWVANAESGMFKKWMYPSNNWFGWMYNWKKKKFSSIEESIKQWIAMYVKNGRAKRATWKDWLKWNYCTSECSHWVENYNSAIKKLELD